MSQISKCPKVTVILSYWEASGEVSKLRYKSLLYCASVGSYCIMISSLFWVLVRDASVPAPTTSDRDASQLRGTNPSRYVKI